MNTQAKGKRSGERSAGAPPDEAVLHEAALSYLARFATTQARLRQVLGRRIARWARVAEREGMAAEARADAVRQSWQAVERVVGRLVESGLVNDQAFAHTRAERLRRSGHSRAFVAAHLLVRGVDRETAKAAAVTDPEMELAAAAVLARQRRFGPFRTGSGDAARVRRELGALARAGFSEDVSRRVLALSAEEAEALIARLKREAG